MSKSITSMQILLEIVPLLKETIKVMLTDPSEISFMKKSASEIQGSKGLIASKGHQLQRHIFYLPIEKKI